jgi:hypothetical protein
LQKLEPFPLPGLTDGALDVGAAVSLAAAVSVAEAVALAVAVLPAAVDLGLFELQPTAMVPMAIAVTPATKSRCTRLVLTSAPTDRWVDGVPVMRMWAS